MTGPANSWQEQFDTGEPFLTAGQQMEKLNMEAKRMTNPDAIAAIVERLEKATGPDGKLDRAIYETVFGYRHAGASHVDGRGVMEDFWLTGAPDNVISGQIKIGRAPMYTFCIDEARKLLEVGTEFSVGGSSSDYMTPHSGRAEVWRQENYISEYSPQFNAEGVGATPALALCIASLKARQSP